jgi:hypothetical protein
MQMTGWWFRRIAAAPNLHGHANCEFYAPKTTIIVGMPFGVGLQRLGLRIGGHHQAAQRFL